MSTDYDYTTTFFIDPSLLSPEIVADGLPAPESAIMAPSGAGSFTRITFTVALSGADKTTLDTLMADQTRLDLVRKKAGRYKDIDARTRELIVAGFTHASKTFSASMEAQQNLVDLKNASDETWITFPYKVSTMDNDEHSLADAAAADSFCQAGSDAIRGHIESGRDLKVSIQAAVDAAAVDAIVDNR